MTAFLFHRRPSQFQLYTAQTSGHQIFFLIHRFGAHGSVSTLPELQNFSVSSLSSIPASTTLLFHTTFNADMNFLYGILQIEQRLGIIFKTLINFIPFFYYDFHFLQKILQRILVFQKLLSVTKILGSSILVELRESVFKCQLFPIMIRLSH